MAHLNQDAEETQVGSQHSRESPVYEKAQPIHEETAHDAAERGTAATDQYVATDSPL